jgi:hypothetical protein
MRKAFGFIFLGILSCASATATPIFDFNRDTTPEFTQSLPFFIPVFLKQEKSFDFDGFDGEGPLTFAKFVDCFFKFPDNDPPEGNNWFWHDPDPSSPSGDPPGDPVTPEPPAWTLLGIGLAGLALFRRKLAS